MPFAIEICDLKKIYKGKTLLEINHFAVQSGELVGITGENGSGKSMLLKTICGFVRPNTGRVSVLGHELRQNGEFPKEIGFVLDGTSFIARKTALQNLTELASIRKIINVTEIRAALVEVGLDPDDSRKVMQYSTGMQKRLAIAQAIMEKPQILVLDEPFSGLDKDSTEKVRELIYRFHSSGTTILLSEHHLDDIRMECTNEYEICEGRIYPVKIL